jgi:outer membrane receptor for ferrienterochelin and colicins
LSAAVPCVLLIALAPVRALAAEPDDDDEATAGPVTEVVVTARRLDTARANVEPSLGASTYTLSNVAVERLPGGETTNLSQVLLQTPGVTQGGSGQLHVREDRGDLQYRINNVALPEGLSDFGQILSPRLADRIELVTGALAAQYGLQVAGIVNITTKSGVYQNGGQAEIYGGSHGEIEPAFEYGESLSVDHKCKRRPCDQ